MIRVERQISSAVESCGSTQTLIVKELAPSATWNVPTVAVGVVTPMPYSHSGVSGLTPKLHASPTRLTCWSNQKPTPYSSPDGLVARAVTVNVSPTLTRDAVTEIDARCAWSGADAD